MEWKTRNRHGRYFVIWLASLMLLMSAAASGKEIPARTSDPHRNEIGFFDIHVCNWPDRPEFFYILFATERFAEVAGIEVYRPDRSLIGNLDMSRFRLLTPKGKPVKQVFMKQFATSKTDVDGWYSATVLLKDGRRIEARDFVKVKSLPLVNMASLFPANGAKNISLPEELRWEPIAGANFYQVFITDIWSGNQQYSSEVLKEPRFKLPQGLVESGGMYIWRVHARDINEDEKLGDFNSGSLGVEAKFTVK